MVARNVLTGEIKYFLSNQVPGRGGWILRDLPRIAFGRWQVEGCLREAKEELGLDHLECRGWHCIHRHLYVAIFSGLFCVRVRQKLSPWALVISGELLTMERVRRASNAFIGTTHLTPIASQEAYAKEVSNQQFYSRRNATAARAHLKKRLKQLEEIGIDSDKVKSISPKSPPC